MFVIPICFFMPGISSLNLRELVSDPAKQELVLKAWAQRFSMYLMALAMGFFSVFFLTITVS
jgi:hypothetical protein